MNPGQPAAGPENSYFRHDGLGDFEVEENRVLELTFPLKLNQLFVDFSPKPLDQQTEQVANNLTNCAA